MAHPHPPFLSADHLGVALPDGRALFGGLSLSLGGERTGLVGANGVGKTVLLDVLAGVRPPTTGTLVRRGRTAYLRQLRRAASPRETVAHRLGVADRLEALSRVLCGHGRPADLDRVGPDGWDLPDRLRAALDRVGLGHLEPLRPFSSLSGGEATRLELVGALLTEPDLLLLDEPTNDLDASSRDHLLRLLDDWGGGLLMVSHDREALRRVDRILELRPGGMVEYGGGYDAYRGQRDTEAAAAREELASAAAARRKARVEARRTRERQERRSARGRRARAEGGVPKIVLNAMRSRSQATTRRLGLVQEEVVERAEERVTRAATRVVEVAAPRMDVAPSELPAGKSVVELEAVGYTPPAAARPVLDGVDLVLRGPERVAVTGPNGAGKSTLLRLVMGEVEPTAGAVRRGVPPERVAYLDQRADLLRPGATVLECFREAHPGWDESHARWILSRYLFPEAAVGARVDRLSGGERIRAGLACVLGGPVTPWLLVLDEPTNHLDFASLETVEGAVAAYDGALLVVSHDPDFRAAVGVGRTVDLPPPEARA